MISGNFQKNQKIQTERDYPNIIFSKMTFANLSQATAASKRVYHRTRNTFNRIQNTYMSIEIHHQGKLRVKCWVRIPFKLKHHFVGHFQFQQCYVTV